MGVSVAFLLLSASNVLQKWCLRWMFWGNGCISAIECCEYAAIFILENFVCAIKRNFSGCFIFPFKSSFLRLDLWKGILLEFHYAVGRW